MLIPRFENSQFGIVVFWTHIGSKHQSELVGDVAVLMSVCQAVLF